VLIADSIVDAGGGMAVSAKKSDVSISHSTVLGAIESRTFDADTSILVGTVEVERRQTGCVRFSYLPDDSATPRRYRCQPDLALKDVPSAMQAAVRARVVPQFTSVTYGEAAYCQLARQCCVEVARGAEDGDEMGAFHFLQSRARETALAASLDEYLRFGLEAGVIYVT
jgi:hypothetical protein